MILAILGVVAVAILVFVALAVVLRFLRLRKIVPPEAEDAAAAIVVSSHGSGG